MAHGGGSLKGDIIETARAWNRSLYNAMDERLPKSKIRFLFRELSILE